ncbi:MAG: type II toxin-antitoxin system VapC family toxin [Verrucomicrobiales bacterium]|nr:type II toxin-antitoxin system VapC family toxin [Verrucomicrobiales bacterium]
MKYLLDTCVVSEIQRRQGDKGVKARVRSFDVEQVYLSSVTLGEISYGIARLDEGERRRDYELFLETLESDYGDHVLSINGDVAKIWGELTAEAQKKGDNIEMADGLIAATAKFYGLYVVTRNVRHFLPTGVMILNPWADGEM